MAKAIDHKKLLDEISELKANLLESHAIIDAIKEGDIDALVLNNNGKPSVYSIESADYTYRLLIEKFSEGALSISDSGLILFCNNSFSKLVGFDADKIIGTYFNSFIDSVGHFHDLKNGLKDGMSKGEIVLNIESRKVPVMMSITDLKPQVNALGIIISDLSEKIKYEETIDLYQKKLDLKINELNSSNEYLEQFVYVASNNIKETLKKIIAQSSHVKSLTNQLDEQELSKIDGIHTSAKRVTELINDLTKYTLSGYNIEVQDEDLNSMIKEVSEDFEILLKKQNTILHYKDLPHVIGSKVQLRQIFENIISHSIAHRKKEGKHIINLVSEITDCVDINLPNKKYFRINISDNGAGIKPTQLKNIFTFSHTLQPKVNENDINGVGLAISKKIMENHHGTLEVVSSQNTGTMYKLYFPVKY